ncbi:MAG: N-acetyltransferase [Micrococcus sp.]|nr:N-acetyltransferase [Micrococcus sp.]
MNAAAQNHRHSWPCRVVDHDDAADRAAVRQINLQAFESTAEADLVEDLRADAQAWLPQFSMVSMTAAIPGTDLYSDPVAYGLLVRARIGDTDTLALAPHGVLPEHQGQGAGTAVVEALLAAAREAGEKHVVVYGFPEFYPRFGFGPASEYGVHAEFATREEALQILVLEEGAQVPSGEFVYPPAFGAENANAGATQG